MLTNLTNTLYILIGFPGSGKSTWAKVKARELNTIIICRDSFRTMFKHSYVFNKEYEPLVMDMAFNSAELAIENNNNVIIDETNLTKLIRLEWLTRCHKAARKVLVWCQESEKNLENRMKDDRGCSKEKWHEIIENMKKTFEAPGFSESVDEIIFVKNVPVNLL